MKIHLFKLSFVLFYLVTIIQIQEFNAQNNVVTDSSEPTTFLVIKNNGGEYIGEIISDDGREILMVTKSIGKIFIYKSDISSITPIDLNTTNSEMGTFKKESPFSTRYYFTNNALPIKQNENYALIHLFGPEIQLTVTPTTSLGIMCSWIASPIGIALKQQLYTKNNFHLSLGTIMGSSGYIEQGGILGGLHWLTMTIGDRVKNFSFSAGYGYIVDNARAIFYNNVNKTQNAMVISFAGITPVGKKASLIFDSMIISNKKDNPNYGRTNSWWRNYNNTDKEITNSTLIMMPSLRINQSYEKAFQLSLAGVIRIDNSKMKGHNSSSFPVPTLSWLRKF